MNIGIFSDCYLPTKNGVATVIAQSRQELERRGHKVVVFTVASPGVSSRDPGIHRYPSLPFIPQIEIRLGLVQQAAVDRITAAERLEVIHTHTEFSLGWAGRCAARRAGLPLVHTLHTLYPAYRHYVPAGRLLPERAVYALLARFLRVYDLVVCPSEKGRGYLASIISGVSTAVVGNGAARDRFDPSRVTGEDRDRARASLGIGPADRVILYVGRLAPEKRVLALLHALGPLLHADAACRAVFVGAGPARDAVASAARAAGLQRQVLLTGPVAWERMAHVCAIAHAFATVSLSEIHPMTLIEAILSGLPIVARRDPGCTDLVLDGVNGFLVDSDADVAGRLAAILHDDALRQFLAENAKALAPRLTIEAHVDRLETLYRTVARHH